MWKAPVLHSVHLAAAVLWLGGLAFVALVLGPALRRGLAPEARLALLREVGRRFRAVGWAAFTVLLVTGLLKLLERGPLAQAFQGDWGRILAVKLALVGAMAVLDVLHGAVWGPGLERAAPGSPEHARLRWRLAFWSRVEFGLGAGILLCAGWLRMTPY